MKSNYIGFKTTDDELKAINEEAKNRNMSVSEFIRWKLKQDIVGEKTTNETLSTLIKQNRNLNIMCYRLLVAFMLINYADNANIGNIANLNEEKLKKLAERTNYNVTDILEWYVANPDEEDWAK